MQQNVYLQSHSQCQQHPSLSMTCTGESPLVHVGLGGGLQIMGTTWTILSSIHTALVQLQSSHDSPGCVWKDSEKGKTERNVMK